MVKDVSFDKMTILATLQSQRITPVCVHEYEFYILFLVEVAVSVYKFIIILIEVFAHICIFLMRLSLKMV